MSDTPTPGGYATAEGGGFKVTSNTESTEQLNAILNPESGKAEEKPDISKAASELGKKGGEAAAAVKRAKAKEEAKNERSQAPSDEPGTVETADQPLDGGEAETGGASDNAVSADVKPLGKPRDDPRARIRQALERQRQAEAVAQQERAERERLAAELAAARAPKAPDQPKQPDPDAKPTAEQFDSYEDFVEAKARWAARQEYAEQRKQAAQRFQVDQHFQAFESHVGDFSKRIAEAEKVDPQIRQKIAEPIDLGDGRQIALDQLVPTSALSVIAPGTRPGPWNDFAEELLSSEEGPNLMLHFKDHPEDMLKITSLPNKEAIVRAVARIEARLEAVPEKPSSRPAMSLAKPPIKAITGSPHTSDSAPGDDAPYEAHKAYWNAREQKKAR